MCTVAIDIPDAVLYDNNMSVQDAESFARRMTAFGLYRQGNVSLGYCATIAGMSKEDFILFLGEMGFGIFDFMTEEDLVHDVESLGAVLERARG